MVVNKAQQNTIEQQMALLLGLKQKTIGKTEARQMGSVKIIGDLEATGKRMTKEFEKATKESGRKLRKELR